MKDTQMMTSIEASSIHWSLYTTATLKYLLQWRAHGRTLEDPVLSESELASHYCLPDIKALSVPHHHTGLGLQHKPDARPPRTPSSGIRKLFLCYFVTLFHIVATNMKGDRPCSLVGDPEGGPSCQCAR